MSKSIYPDAIIGHCRVVSQIGAGGMGEVYLAKDTKLDRKVALKILHADLAANHDRMRRFVQEAKAAAALNHPNIAHIYKIGESDETNFIAMEFGDGESLHKKIYREKSELKVLLKHFLQVAFVALNEAVETKDQHAAWMKVDPYMDPLRDDPRFQVVLRKVGFSQLESICETAESVGAN